MLWIVLVLLGLVLVLCIVVLMRLAQISKSAPASDLERLERMMHGDAKDLRQELGQNLMTFNEAVRKVLEDRLETMRLIIFIKMTVLSRM